MIGFHTDDEHEDSYERAKWLKCLESEGKTLVTTTDGNEIVLDLSDMGDSRYLKSLEENGKVRKIQ